MGEDEGVMESTGDHTIVEVYNHNIIHLGGGRESVLVCGAVEVCHPTPMGPAMHYQHCVTGPKHNEGA